MRLLADDGISATQLVGIDIVDFWGLGFELFRDQESEFGKAAKFSKGDILDLDSLERGLGDDGKVDVVYVSQVLHQFDVERQVAAAKNLLAVTRGPGSLIVGAQIGYQTGRESLMKVPPGEPQPWMHDGGSWAELWRRVEREMGMELKVETRLREREEYRMDRETTKFMGEDMRVLEFQVTRVK
ncbi:MAG: hypothetical protein M1820_006778 [Bogoriella megaspora]|nr:MAG: hypothetical protein M1820_006778 [Bogoriella megaspora]